MIQKLSLSLVLFCFFSCNTNDNNFDDSYFTYIKLKDFKYVKADIKPFSKIQLLSVSGGRKCTNKEIYFYQFVGIVEGTNDTVRILSPCQEYDSIAKPRIGSYIPIDNSPEGINKFIDPSGKDQILDENNFFVVVNTKHFTDKGNYKTIIGGLAFND